MLSLFTDYRTTEDDSNVVSGLRDLSNQLPLTTNKVTTVNQMDAINVTEAEVKKTNTANVTSSEAMNITVSVITILPEIVTGI